MSTSYCNLAGYNQGVKMMGMFKISHTHTQTHSPRREAWRKSLGGAGGLSKQRLFLLGLLLKEATLTEASLWGEESASGSGQSSPSNRDEQSGSPEPREDTLTRSEFRSWNKNTVMKPFRESGHHQENVLHSPVQWNNCNKKSNNCFQLFLMDANNL